MRLTDTVGIEAGAEGFRRHVWTDEGSVLDQAAFSACMARLEPFEDEPLLAIAVSGGADSLALTLLADHWARQRRGRVVGLTVDHGLRSGSDDEARQTGLWLAERDIEHHILTWSGDKPKTGLQRHARDARYALLTAWCMQHGCFHLMTAHHRQDQAETVALRKLRKSGRAGLAAMAAVREIEGLRLLRPLLGIDKARLEDTLRAEAQPWLNDPSNDSQAFERNRLRQAGLDVEKFADEAERQGLYRRDADRQVTEALVRHVIIDPAGFATLDAAGFERLPKDLASDLLTRLLITIGGRIYPPRSDALSRLLDDIRGEVPQRVEQRPGRTLAHCRILKSRGRWLICRERPSPERLMLEPRRAQRWDDRFAIHLFAPQPDLAIGALGGKGRHGEETLKPKGKTRRIAAVMKPTLPAIWRGADLIAIPPLGLYDDSLTPDDLDLQFCPRSPLANGLFMPHISS
ncbi:MAG: tRNA lysidine(34) synthetase TilS [Pseudomonadota bacterium]